MEREREREMERKTRISLSFRRDAAFVQMAQSKGGRERDTHKQQRDEYPCPPGVLQNLFRWPSKKRGRRGMDIPIHHL